MFILIIHTLHTLYIVLYTIMIICQIYNICYIYIPQHINLYATHNAKHV